MILSGTANYFLEPNTDTDVIIPARFLKRTSLDGYTDFAFYEKRYHPDTICEASLQKKDYVFKKTIFNQKCSLNHPNAKNAIFLLTWLNFGCGSSREHAVYALNNYKVIIGSAPPEQNAFADIFQDNCRQNLIWTPVLQHQDHQKLAKYLEQKMKNQPVSLSFDTQSLTLSTTDGSLNLQTTIPNTTLSFLRKSTENKNLSAKDIARQGIEEKLTRIDQWREKNQTLVDSYPSSK